MVSIRSNIAPACALAFAAIAAPVAHIVQAAPAPGTTAPVLVIARPGIAVDDVIRLAGGNLVGPTSAPMARLAAGGPDFVGRLQGSIGVWVMDGRILAAICGVGE